MAVSLAVLDFENAPWENPEDWLAVYVMIQNQNDAQKLRKALEIMTKWQSAAVILPCAIECTLVVVRVCMDEKTATNQLVSKSAYSVALLTFFRLCNVTGNTTNDFLQHRKALDIPEWIGKARKEILSNYDNMTKDELKEFLKLCYNWILTNYWHKEAAETYMVPFKSLHLLISLYCYITSMTYSLKNFVTVGDLKLAKGTMHAKLMKCLGLFRVTPRKTLQEVLVQIMELLSDLRVTYGEMSLKTALSSVVHDFDTIFLFREVDDSETVSWEHITTWSSFVDYLCEFKVLGHFVTELTMAIIYGLFKPLSQRYAGAWVHHLLQRILVTRLHADNFTNSETYRNLKLPNLDHLMPFSNCPADNILYFQIQALDILLDKEEFNPDVWKFLNTLSFITRYHSKIQEWKTREQLENIPLLPSPLPQMPVSQIPRQQSSLSSLMEELLSPSPMQALLQPIQMTLQPMSFPPYAFLTSPSMVPQYGPLFYPNIALPATGYNANINMCPPWYYPTINMTATSIYH